MKAAILVESLTAHLEVGEMIGGQLQQAGWQITALSRVREPDYAALQAADMVGRHLDSWIVRRRSDTWALGSLAPVGR